MNYTLGPPSVGDKTATYVLLSGSLHHRKINEQRRTVNAIGIKINYI